MECLRAKFSQHGDLCALLLETGDRQIIEAGKIDDEAGRRWVLGFAVGMRGGIDAAVFVYFVGCGISRLARYNATAAALSDDSGKVAYFEGTPIPTSLGLVLVLAILTWQGRIAGALPGGTVELFGFVLHPLTLMYLVSGSAMISKTLRIPKI